MILELKNINKKYDRDILKDFNLKVNKGEAIGVSGESGSGKSTILNIIGLLEKPDSGEVILFGKNNPKINQREGIELLKYKIGYLFQSFALVENETVSQNLDLALRFNTAKNKEELKQEILKKLNIESVLDKKIYQLSGGEQQRVAIARLFLKPCELILADEPTGSLDAKNRDLIMKYILELKKLDKTIILVSHDPEVLKYCEKVIKL